MHSDKITLCINNNNDPRYTDLLCLMKAMPFISEVISLEECKKRKFDEYFYTTWTCGGDAYNYFKSKHPYSDEQWNHEKTHETDYYFSIVKKYYGYTGKKPEQYCPYTPMEKDTTKIRIGVCNGGFGNIAVMKKWNYFPQLCGTLKGWYGNDIELVKVGYYKELSNVNVYDVDYAGHTMLENATMINSLDLFITTDTGNMHIADALKVPMIVLWGGTSFVKNRPINGTANIIRKHFPCQPCHNDGTYMQCNKIECLQSITVGEVFREVRKKLL